MKKSRLLEIIREEINEAFYRLKNPADEKKGFEPQINVSGMPEPEILSKYKKLAEEELEEEQLDEMAYNIVLSNPEKLAKLKDEIKDSTKEGKKLLYKIIDIIQRDKKENKPIRQRDIANELGIIQQKVNPLINYLIDYGILDKGESVTGVTKKKVTDKPQGRPSNPDKPEKAPSTGQRGRKPGTKTATRTPGNDGFDDVSYSDEEVEDTYYKDEDEFTSPSEEGPSSAEIKGDKTAKELAQASPASKDENFDRIRTGLMNKVKKAKGELSAEDKKLAIQIINSAKEKYKFNAVQVDALRAVAGL